MADSPPTLVVRTYAPARRRIVAVALLLLASLALYLAYELGRYDAGYDRLAAAQQEAQFEVELERMDQTNRGLRLKIAESDTQRIGQTTERSELSKAIGELQATVARQSQELAFYQGIVVQGANASEVKVQQLRVDSTEDPRRFRVRLTLVQPVRPDRVVDGTVRITVAGDSTNGESTLGLGDMTEPSTPEIAYSFRYFENIDPEITFPEGFTPERLEVEVRSGRKGVAPVTQSMLWNVEA